MGKKSREKGVRGELEAAALMRETFPGLACERGQQRRGGEGVNDLKHALEGVHIEVKRVECLRLGPTLEQMTDEREDGEARVLLHRRNRMPWVFVVPVEDMPRLARALLPYLPEEPDVK